MGHAVQDKVRKGRKKVKGCNGLKGHSLRFSASFVRIRHDRKFSRGSVVDTRQERKSLGHTRIDAFALRTFYRLPFLRPSRLRLSHILFPFFSINPFLSLARRFSRLCPFPLSPFSFLASNVRHGHKNRRGNGTLPSVLPLSLAVCSSSAPTACSNEHVAPLPIQKTSPGNKPVVPSDLENFNQLVVERPTNYWEGPIPPELSSSSVY